MGVRGLKSYMAKHPNVAVCAQEVALVSPWEEGIHPGLVIDGNGLIFEIFRELDLQIIIARNGGAYELFEKVIYQSVVINACLLRVLSTGCNVCLTLAWSWWCYVMALASLRSKTSTSVVK